MPDRAQATSPARAQHPALAVDVDRLCLGRRTVLSQVQFSCEQGAHLAILGPNGAGKTTLLRALVGLLPFDGQVRLGRDSLSALTDAERAQRIAYVPQRSSLNAALRVEDVVLQGRYAHQRGWTATSVADRAAVRSALEMTDIVALRERHYPQLSGGEQRRVLLARALATEAPIIVLDEPTAALDIAHALSLFERLNELLDIGRTIITVLHDLRDAERWCTEALVLHDGHVAYRGAAALPPELVRRIYQVESIANAATHFELSRGAP